MIEVIFQLICASIPDAGVARPKRTCTQLSGWSNFGNCSCSARRFFENSKIDRVYGNIFTGFGSVTKRLR